MEATRSRYLSQVFETTAAGTASRSNESAEVRTGVGLAAGTAFAMSRGRT